MFWEYAQWLHLKMRDTVTNLWNNACKGVGTREVLNKQKFSMPLHSLLGQTLWSWYPFTGHGSASSRHSCYRIFPPTFWSPNANVCHSLLGQRNYLKQPLLNHLFASTWKSTDAYGPGLFLFSAVAGLTFISSLGCGHTKS